jgi:hypothetical protein
MRVGGRRLKMRAGGRRIIDAGLRAKNYRLELVSGKLGSCRIESMDRAAPEVATCDLGKLKLE